MPNTMKLPLWTRLLIGVPFLTRPCPFGNYHWRWSRLCTCGFGEPVPEDNWHGGVYDLIHQIELHPCVACIPEHSAACGHYALSNEEQVLVASWRVFREETLDTYAEDSSWRYTVNVRLNNEEDIFLMSRVNGAAVLHQTKAHWEEGMPSRSKPN